MVGQNLPFVIQTALIEGQGSLQGVDDLHSARVTDETINILKLQALAFEHPDHRRSEVFAGERRNGAVEDHAQTGRADAPAHDVQTSGPGVFARRLDRGEARLAAAHHTGGRPVAEQRRRNNVRLGQILHPERKGAELDHDHEDHGPRRGLGQPSRKGEARRSAGAAEAEDRDPRCIGAKSHPGHGAGLKAGRGDARR